MDYHYPSPRLGPDPFSAEGQALIRSNLWMRVGFVGASALAIGVITLFSGDWQPLAALATIAAGGALAALAWRRSWTILSRIDKGEDMTPVPAAPFAVARNPRVFAADWAAS